VPFTPPAPAAGDKPLPINLPTALQLAGVRPLDIALTSQRIRLAVAQLDQAQVLWLPSLSVGVDYFRHDGRLQDVAGNLLDTSKSTFMIGCAPIAVFAVSDALFEPLVARQVVRARQFDRQAAANDSLLAVAEAYFNVQEARGNLAGAEDAVRLAADLLRRTESLAPRFAPPVEISRARTELARRKQVLASFRERWRTASADLARLLRLDPTVLLEPLEPPHLRVSLFPTDQSVDDLIPVALTNRPELAAQQSLVQATLQRLRQERLRPLVPSVLLRGAATNPAGTLAAGVFGGGRNESISNFAARGDFDVQLLWELKNFGFGYLAKVDERKAEQQQAVLELFRTQDRIAAEVAQALAQAQSAASRVADAETELKNAADSANKNLEGLKATKAGGEVIPLINRPQEAVAAVQALAQAYSDYYGAVADYDRAQFRLYRALGQPAQILTGNGADCPDPSASCAPTDSPPSAPVDGK
jgi:outer membrane protein TolC